MSIFLRRLVAVLPVTALVLGGSLLVDADSAEAFGYNRAVSRTCGSNWVSSSGTLAGGSATTSHHTGSCQDKLVAGLNAAGQIVWQTATSARATASIYRSNLGDTTGRHKGCPTCAVTLS